MLIGGYSMQKYLSLSITAHADRNVTHYERGGMELYNCQQRSRMICCWGFRVEVKKFETESLGVEKTLRR